MANNCINCNLFVVCLTGNSQSSAMEHYPLHKAARFGHLEKVTALLESGEISQVNPREYTPLHCAAMAIKPNEHVAKLLIEFNGTEWLNKQTEDSRDTALHIAAANVNVTQSFIQQFEEADSKLLNDMYDTPFHVAAKSHNQEAVIYMLNTFDQTINNSNVNDMDEGQVYFLNSLIKICAINGNAKAVKLLIGYGADISRGVLHEIVLESVKKPSKMNQLMNVYQTIVDNAITWRGLKESDVFFSSWRSDSPMRHLRETMIWLLTNSLDEYGNKDVLQFALDYGADEMLWRIINTKYVFRIDGKEFSEWFGVPEENPPNDYNWTVFDVTNFTQHTLSKPGQEPVGRNSVSGVAFELNSLSSENLQANSKVRDFKNPERPRHPYLANLLLASQHWKEKDILNRQPFKQLTQPYIKLIRSCFFIFGLLQLIFISCFSALQMPTACSLAQMFNISTMHCNNDTGTTVPPSNGRQRSWFALFWLMWPAVLISVTVFIVVQYIKQEAFDSLSSKNKTPFRLKAFLDAFLQSAFSVLFCFAVFIWLFVYFTSESMEMYVAATAFVLLFGWFANLRFFEVGTEKISILGLLLHEIVSKDMPSFMPHFLCIVVGFAFAVHALRTSSCTPNGDLNHTFFNVLSSAFGIGDFYGGTMREFTCASVNMQYLFELIYFFYVSVIILIMLNILIAMMNLRYEKMKAVAGNVLRFQLLSVMTALEDLHEKVEKVLKKFRLLNVPDVAYCGDSFRDDRDDGQGYLYFNNRYYLQLVQPADEQLQERQ